MKRLVNHWSAVLLLVSAASLAHGQSPSPASSLKIEIRLQRTTVRSMQPVVVHTKISNISNGVQRLQVWSCSYDESWKSDHPAVFIEPASCRANGPLGLQLKPGEAYERKLFVYVLVAPEKHQQQPLTFRLGFNPRIVPANKSLSFIWSNPVTVKVRENL